MLALSGCEYAKLLRASVLKQLNPDETRLVDELPAVDHPNQALLARLYATGGLRDAKIGSDGIMRQSMSIPVDQFIWKPAIIVMPQGGALEAAFLNGDAAGSVVARIGGDEFAVALPQVDQVKIDGSFVTDISSNRQSVAMIRAIVSLTKELGVGTVAEYAENARIIEHLRALDVECAQRYGVEKPRRFREVLDELRARESAKNAALGREI